MWHVWKLNRYADIHFFSVTSSCTPPPCPRDDNFSDTLSQKADSEASSGHTGEDRCSGKDMASPTDTRISEAYITRSVHWDHEIIPFQQSVTKNLREISSDWSGQKWYRKYLVVCYLLPIALLVFSTNPCLVPTCLHQVKRKLDWTTLAFLEIKV